MMTHKKTALIIVTTAFLLVMMSFSGTIRALLMSSMSVPSVGTVKAIGVGVYWDSGCTTPVSSIGWGMIEPNETKTSDPVYIRNEGNADVTLSMETTNWDPSAASGYITLGWDYAGGVISPDGVVQVTFTLSVSSNIEGITSFSFDIIIVGTG